MGSARAERAQIAGRLRPAVALVAFAMATVFGAISPPASGAAVDRATERPASLWHLGETSGTTAHDAARRHNGSYVGGVRLGQPPARRRDSDRSARFDGLDDFVSFGDAFDRYANLPQSGVRSTWVNRSKMRVSIASGMPMPVSRTRSTAAEG